MKDNPSSFIKPQNNILIHSPQAMAINMESQGRTEITLSIGEMPANPGTSALIDLLLGEANASKVKQECQSRTGKEFENFHFYTTIKCTSESSAETLKTALNSVWTTALSGDGNDPLSALLRSKMKPDPDESALLEAEFSVSSTNVVIDLKLGTTLMEQAEASFEMVVETAGNILANDQNIHLEFDLGKSLTEILHHENIGVALLGSVKFCAVIGLNTALSSELKGILEGFGVPAQALSALAVVGLYESATLDLKFKSVEQLPEEYKQQAKAIMSVFDPAAIKDNVPEEVRNLVNLMCEHGDGELTVVGGAGVVMLEVKVKAPGLSEFFSSR